MTNADDRGLEEIRIGVVTEAFVDRPLIEVMDWLREGPLVTDLEIGTGGYAPTQHCDMTALLRDQLRASAGCRDHGARTENRRAQRLGQPAASRL